VTPATVHLVAQLIRNERDLLTAIEKWIKAQDETEGMRELRQVVALRRSVAAICERQLVNHQE
jgi:hypothetical protein